VAGPASSTACRRLEHPRPRTAVAGAATVNGGLQLVVFKLPKDRLVLGPIQIEATIDQDTTISRQLTLWDQRGSRVIRGHLLAGRGNSRGWTI